MLNLFPSIRSAKYRCNRKKGLVAIGLVLSPAAMLCAGVATAATLAGTTITNVAHISYDLGGTQTATDSNPVALRVGEIIALTVEPAPACALPPAADGKTAVGFLLTNQGNGVESFIPGEPTVSDDSGFVPEAVFADTNHNNCYDPGIDTLIPPGGPTPELQPGESIVLFVVGTRNGPLGRVTLRVVSSTGSGAVGTVFAGAGDGGTDAIIGTGGGSAGGVPGTPSSATGLAASLLKSQVVLAPDGSDKPMHNAVITYRLEGRFSGAGTATNVQISDAIPAGTTYVPGSITLDGTPVSDTAGDDAGGFDGAAVAVALGDVPSPAIHAVSFQVKIK